MSARIELAAAHDLMRSRLAVPALVIVGVALLSCHLFVAHWIRQPDFPESADQTWNVIALLLMAGGLWLATCCSPLTISAPVLALAIVIGLLMRLSYLGGPTLHEADSNRYLWDGAVVSAGINPYENAPSAARVQRITRSVAAVQYMQPDASDWALADIADQSGAVFDEIRYAEIRTIYPPLAQAFFFLAHQLQPYSIDAWRIVLLSVEATGLLILLALLKSAGLPQASALIYWWNPLLIVQFAASGHMDALLLPVLLIVLWAFWRGRAWAYGMSLAVATALKLWPIILLPLVSRIVEGRRRLIAVVIGSGLLTAALLTPQLRYLSGDANGLVLFAEYWERNSLLFYCVLEFASDFIENETLINNSLRLLVACVAMGIVIASARREATTVEGCAGRLALPIGVLLLLSPTAYPWYYAWLLPFLCFWRHPAFLLLGVSLTLYYAGFALKPFGGPEGWPLWVRLLEFVPVWVALTVGALRARQSTALNS